MKQEPTGSGPSFLGWFKALRFLVLWSILNQSSFWKEDVWYGPGQASGQQQAVKGSISLHDTLTHTSGSMWAVGVMPWEQEGLC